MLTHIGFCFLKPPPLSAAPISRPRFSNTKLFKINCGYSSFEYHLCLSYLNIKEFTSLVDRSWRMEMGGYLREELLPF
ncbi:hypothetical protein Lal_00044804 [Lupinus albus]|nr:hypothetical protein Lal_00044804 [Lupinus albus]